MRLLSLLHVKLWTGGASIQRQCFRGRYRRVFDFGGFQSGAAQVQATGRGFRVEFFGFAAARLVGRYSDVGGSGQPLCAHRPPSRLAMLGEGSLEKTPSFSFGQSGRWPPCKVGRMQEQDSGNDNYCSEALATESMPVRRLG